MLQDLRQALRTLAKRSSSAILTVIVFALAIGANTTVFSAFNGFLLRPMPFPDDGLVMVYASAPKMGLEDGGTDAEGFLEWRKAPALEAGAIFTTSERTLEGAQPAERISVTRGTPSLWAVLGVAPILGAAFTEDHAVPGNDRVVLLSHRLWTTRFNARPDVVGEDVQLDDGFFRVIGVMPDGFGLRWCRWPSSCAKISRASCRSPVERIPAESRRSVGAARSSSCRSPPAWRCWRVLAS